MNSKTVEGQFRYSIQTFADKAYWVCPAELFNEDSITGAMITDFAKMCHARIKLISSPGLTTTGFFNKEFIKGLWFGIYSTTNQTRSRAKKEYELGRSCIFSLCVKSYFEKTACLGAPALVKDHFFFGNNPPKKNDKNPASFYIKQKLTSFWSDTAVGDFVYSLCLKTSSTIGLSNLRYSDYNNTILNHMIPYNEIVSKLYPEVPVKGRKGKLKKVKPLKIRQSPLFAKEEMTYVSGLLSYIFTDKQEFHKDFLSSVFKYGWSTINAWAIQSIAERRTILARFAHVTKERLQRIRVLLKDAKVRKAGVDRQMVINLLRSTPELPKMLIREVQHILASNDLRHLSLQYKYGISIPKEDTDKFILTQIADLYSSMSELLDRKDEFTDGLDRYEATLYQEDLTRTVKSILSLERKVGMINIIASHSRHTKSYAVPKLVEELNGLESNMGDIIQDIANMDNDTVSAALLEVPSCTSKSCQSYLNSIVHDVKRLLTEILKNSTEARNKETNPNAIALWDKLISCINQFRIFVPEEDSTCDDEQVM